MDLTIESFGKKTYPGVFIRAPIIKSAAKNVEILCQTSEEIFAAKQGKLLAVAFHPELTDDTRFHELFLEMVLKEK